MSGFEFSILGPVEAAGDEGALPLGGPRQRALLAYLLLHANTVVGSDRLVDELWETPPGDAHAALQNQVSRLRKVLGERLSTRAPGYALLVEPGELDLDRFRAAVAEAGSTSDLAERSRHLREADALFRGSPLAGVDAPFAAGEAVALEELRLAAVEARVDADLERGRHAELVPELGGLVARHPLRERLRGQQILALYRSGRQAEALEAYRDTRRMLDEQLGLEPSPALRELERAILTQDPTLVSVATVETQPATADPEPASPARRRRRGVIVAIAAGVLALMGVGVAAAVLVTEKDAPRASGATPLAAVTPVARRSPARRVKSHLAQTRAAPRKVVHHVGPRVPVKRTHRAHPAPVVHLVAATTPTKTTTAVTTTQAPKPKTHTTPATTTTNAAPAGVPADSRTLADDFSQPTPNAALWNIFGDGSGYTWALQNGRLILTIPADAQPGGKYNMVSITWGSQCRFDGDFDERMDYQLLEWPDGVGAHLQINAWVFPGSNSSAGRMINQFSDQYNGQVDQSFKYVSSQDTTGTLRLTRVNGVDTAYYLANGKWVVLNSGSAPGQAMLGVQFYGMGNEWTHKEMRVAVDNFSVTAASIVCP